MDSYKTYFRELIHKYNFINAIYITDYEGLVLINATINEEDEGENDKTNKIKISLSYNFNSALDQITKTERWKTKNLLTVFDNKTIFQSRINKTIFAHFICDNNSFNYEILKEITTEIDEKLQKVEKELVSLTHES